MKKYPFVDSSGMKWRMEGGRPVSEFADQVMSQVMLTHKERRSAARSERRMIRHSHLIFFNDMRFYMQKANDYKSKT